VPLNRVGTEGAFGLTLVVCLVETVRERAFADKSVAVKTIRKMLTRKNDRLTRMRAEVEREFDFIWSRVGREFSLIIENCRINGRLLRRGTLQLKFGERLLIAP